MSASYQVSASPSGIDLTSGIGVGIGIDVRYRHRVRYRYRCQVSASGIGVCTGLISGVDRYRHRYRNRYRYRYQVSVSISVSGSIGSGFDIRCGYRRSCRRRSWRSGRLWAALFRLAWKAASTPCRPRAATGRARRLLRRAAALAPRLGPRLGPARHRALQSCNAYYFFSSECCSFLKQRRSGLRPLLCQSVAVVFTNSKARNISGVSLP